MIWPDRVYTPEGARVFDSTGVYYHKGEDAVTYYMKAKDDYIQHGFRRINGIVWYNFTYRHDMPGKGSKATE